MVDTWVINNRYEQRKTLGAGGMGSVFEVYDRLNQQRVALKRVQKTVRTPSPSMLNPDVTQPADMSTDSAHEYHLALTQEFRILAKLRHPNIISVLDYGFDETQQPFFTMELLEGATNVLDYASELSFEQQVHIILDILQALVYLHRHQILHRDLKPENVLLDADGHVKLGDFGLAKAGIRHAYEGATSMCGTPEYMAPEVLAQQGHGFCVDYWGLGMLTYEMMTGLPPWYTTDRAKLFRRLRSAPLDIPSYFSASSASFSIALLERNPRRRLGVTGIRAAMEHEFYKSISWRALYGRRVEAPIRPCEGWSPPEADQQQTGNATSNAAHHQTTPSNGSFNPNDLDAATANFDNQFTRMPVETDDVIDEGDDEELEELHEDTFVGFTFDDNDRDEAEITQQQAQQMQQRTPAGGRERTHHIQEGNNQVQHHLD